MKRNNLKEIFKSKGYSDEEIENHYKAVSYINNQNKERYKRIELEHKEDIEKLKKHFKKVKVSLKGDGVWCNNDNGRLFIYWNDLENSIKFYG